MLLSYNELKLAVKMGVIDAPFENVKGASIDITIGNKASIEIFVSKQRPHSRRFVNLYEKDTVTFNDAFKVEANDTFCIYPGQFFKTCSAEILNLPNNLAAQYMMKGPLTESGLQLINTGWINPGFNGPIQLALKNATENHVIVLTAGMKIADLVFFECGMVP
jgi:deoxycytidine triphosphate deaminase